MASSKIGKSICVIPDVQAKPGVNIDHLEHIGNYIVEKKPEIVVCLGDFADLPSLSSYDIGKAEAEGKRYAEDVKFAKLAMATLLNPIKEYNRKAKVKYRPRKVMLYGNHEQRILTTIENNPRLIGTMALEDLGYKEAGWEVHPFLEVVKIEGIEMSHYFTSGVLGRPVSSAATLLRERQCSAIMSHVQHTDICFHKKTGNIAMFAGTAYTHDERYLGLQGNCQRRQIVMLHEVNGTGYFDPMLVSLAFLSKNYK